MRLLLPVSIFLATTLVPGAVRAAESYDGCKYTITSLPAVLSSQGVWCLKGDLATAMASGTAITLAASNITLDCNHFKIGGLAAGAGTQTVGIDTGGWANATVRNCNIRGFMTGFKDSDGYGHIVEDNRFEANTGAGIQLQGSGSVVRANRIQDTGGGPFGDVSGIVFQGDNDVIDNTVDGVFPSDSGDYSGFGILSNFVASGTISGNRIRGVTSTNAGTAAGIWNSSSSAVIVDGNYLHGGFLAGSTGIRCTNSLGRSTRNHVLGFATAVVNCTQVDDVQ